MLRTVTDDEDGARTTYAALHSYTIGFAALEASRAGWQGPGAQPDQLAAQTTPEQFSKALTYLVDGIAAGTGRVPTKRSAPRSRQ